MFLALGNVVYSSNHDYYQSTWVVYGVRLKNSTIRYVGLTTQGVIRRFYYNHSRKAYKENQKGPLYNWMRKYTIDSFEVVILSVCLPGDYDSLNNLEIYWIDYFRNIFGSISNKISSNYLLNISDGGLGHTYSGEDHWNFGKNRPESTRTKISITKKNSNIIPWNKGLKGFNEGESNNFYGKTHSEKTKLQMSKSSHNRWHTSRGIIKDTCVWCPKST